MGRGGQNPGPDTPDPMASRMISPSSPERRRKATALSGIVAALGVLLVAAAVFLWPGTRYAHPAQSAEPAPIPGVARPPAGIQVPGGMVFVPGGRTRIGSDDGNGDEAPVFRASVRPFFMDKHPVTVAEFRGFVEATGYITDAERFGEGGVFDAESRSWKLVEGATWRHPFGPRGRGAPDDHPVTQVSWTDAVAYADWAGKRLPTEVEWEHAARGGRDRRSRYAWGDHLKDHQGRHHANTWNGPFPLHDSGGDGYKTSTSPVGAFGETELGLTDMGGNVWEWTADWYRPYAERHLPFAPTPESARAQRGGSYLCSPNYCHGYRVSARSHSTPETSLAHVGFRTVRDLPSSGR